MLVTYIRKVIGSNLCRDSHWLRFFIVLFSRSRQISNSAMVASFRTTADSLCTNHLYKAELQTASFNLDPEHRKQQKNREKYLMRSFIRNLCTSPNIIRVIRWRLVTVAERSKACTVFVRSEAGIVGSNRTQAMDVWCVCVCVCVRERESAFFWVCVQVEVLQRADHPPKESYRMSKI
jgi:hypothetical protein